MSHAVLFGAQVAFVVLVGLNDDGHGLHNLQSVTFEAAAFDGVVGEQPHLPHAEVAQHLGSDAVVAFVGFEAEGEVGVNGVHALLLQVVGFQLVDQADATPLLTHIEDYAATFLLYHAHGLVQLVAAVAFTAAEDVAGGAAGMHTHQHGLIVFPFAFRQRHVCGAVVQLGVGGEFEIAPAGGQEHLFLFADECLVRHTVGDKVFDGDNLDAETLAHLHQLWQTGHGAIVVDDFDEGTSGVESCQSCQVDSRLGVSGTHQHAAVAGSQRVDMTRTT